MRNKNLFESLGLPHDGVEPKDGEPLSSAEIEKLRCFFRGELEKREAQGIAKLIATKETWSDAMMQILIEKGKRAEQQDEEETKATH